MVGNRERAVISVHSSWRTSTTMSTGPSMNFSSDARRRLAPFQDGVVATSVVDEVEDSGSAAFWS